MSKLPEWQTLQVEIGDDGVAEVVLNRPEKGNALNPRLFREYGEAFDHLAGLEEVRVILLHGAGKAFSYGLDLMEAMQELGPALGGGLAKARMELRRHIEELQEVVSAPARAPQPVIAAVHGWCIGGGVDLIAACDIRFAAADARFSVRETRIAIVADLGSLQRLPRIIGDAATRELALTGKDIDAERALRLGLVSEVLPDHATLLAHARAEARRIAQLPPLTVQGVKRVLAFGDGKSIEDGLAYVAAWNAAFLPSEDLGEAVAAFFEKREPRFKGA